MELYRANPKYHVKFGREDPYATVRNYYLGFSAEIAVRRVTNGVIPEFDPERDYDVLTSDNKRIQVKCVRAFESKIRVPDTAFFFDSLWVFWYREKKSDARLQKLAEFSRDEVVKSPKRDGFFEVELSESFFVNPTD